MKRLLTRLAGWSVLDALGERCNAVLTKEVRQALRGRYFMLVFWLAILASTLIGTLTLVFMDQVEERSGTMFFLATFGCLSFAVNVFIPFSAFTSLGNEWDENTFDLLVLSNLRPRHIVWGKLQAAGVQVLLYYFGFLPFLALGFLLRGLDLAAAGRWLLTAFLSSLTLCCAALLLSCLARQRILRVLLMAVFSLSLAWIAFAVTITCVQDMTFAGSPFRAQPWVTLAALGTLALVVGGFSFAFACTRLAHPEENRSTGPRVLSTVAVLGVVAWIAWAYPNIGEPEVFLVFGVNGLVASTLLAILFATEPEPLGRRVGLHVPRSRLAALLASPWLPGGGRGMLLYGLNLLLLFGGALAVAGLVRTPSGKRVDEELAMLGVMAAYAVVYVGLPSAVLSRFAGRLALRIAARVAVPALAFLAFFVPTLVAFILDFKDPFEHLGNPVWIVERVTRGRAGTPLFVLVAVAAGVLLLNAPRVVRGVREVLAASARRRSLERQRASAVEPAPAEGGADAVA